MCNSFELRSAIFQILRRLNTRDVDMELGAAPYLFPLHEVQEARMASGKVMELRAMILERPQHPRDITLGLLVLPGGAL